ncbi:PaaX family transcriptional regulator C-terminal domain-containing protein [Streptomyces sp. NPDC005373]|uniref:PaaX family transcriptional regulator n=1 Tax=Streptomyces sp. NPDC005373 TaxID=3156879 RepID=UPI0033A8B337
MSALQNLGTAHRPRRLIFTILGGYWEVIGEWIRLRTLVQLLRDLGLGDKAARAAIARLVDQGMLEKQPRGGDQGLAFTEAMVDRIQRRARRIYASRQPAPLTAGWLLVSYSLPEAKRDLRHQLRSGLEQLGMRNLEAGQWIGPTRLKSDARELADRLDAADAVVMFVGQFEGFGHVRDLVARCWDLDELEARYREFIARQQTVLAKARQATELDPTWAYEVYTAALHGWRILPFMDPGLPAEVLPADWPGNEGAETFFTLHELLYPAARKHVAARLAEGAGL